MERLRMNQGVAGVFYLPHFAAQALGAFRTEGLEVEFVTTFYGKQWDVLARGDADLSIGGPMRTMQLQSEHGHRLVNFCAAVRANPWYLVGRRPEPRFTIPSLVGRTIIDFGDAATPRLCLRWLLEQHQVAPDRVTLVSNLGTAREIEAFRAGEGDYLLHSLHTAAPLVAAGEGVLVQDMATPTRPVPWSSYAAPPATISAKRAQLEAFTRAITRALRWITTQPASEIAALVARHFPSLAQPVLADAIGRYQALGLWPSEPLVPRADFEHFRSILLSTGWITKAVSYEDQVDTSFAAHAVAALGPTAS